MKLDDFDFDLPKELIAYAPITPRDSSKMLTVIDGAISDENFTDLINYITPNDLLIFNDSKVIAAKISGTVNGKKLELNLHKKINDNSWKAFTKKTKKLKIGDDIIFANQPQIFSAIITNINGGEIQIQFNVQDPTDLIEKYGEMPIPPYIKREVNPSDMKDYQTVYAKNLGSVAAPTAGLHFTSEVFSKFDAKNIKYSFVTLHVGAGTFLPVKVENIHDHKMHSEYCEITKETADLINQTKQNGGKVIVIGTTALRTLEYVAVKFGKAHEFMGENDIFITPGFKFKVADMLLTNFHLPKSTLLMLVSAFSGFDTIKQAYLHAVTKKYRFFSFGDCCLLKLKKQEVA